MSAAPLPSCDRADDDRDAQAVLTIDLDALGSNWRSPRCAGTAPAECAAAVKADAYGIGIAAAVPALARAGCVTFFVAHASEGPARQGGARCRAGLGGRIFVLNGFHPESAALRPLPRRHGLDAVLGSPDGAASAWSEARAEARSRGRMPDAALHVDTGMNRLGFPVEDARLLSPGRAAGSRASPW